MPDPADEVQLVLPNGNELRIVRGPAVDERIVYLEHLDGGFVRQMLCEPIVLDEETLERLILALYRTREELRDERNDNAAQEVSVHVAS